MAAWPATLPDAIVSSWSLAPRTQTRRTEMEQGAPRVRRVSRARLDSVGVGWVMTRTQFYAFREWFDSVSGADGGASWFDFDIQAGQDDAGACTTSEEARFLGEWSAAAIDPTLIRVTATLELR